MDYAARGKQALEAKDYDEAIGLFTSAIKTSPTSPDYLINRSTAYQRKQQYDLALNDAEQGVLAAEKRAKRELIAQAQLRRGIALWGLARYADAEFVLNIVIRMEPKNAHAPMWLAKAKAGLAKSETSEEQKQVTVKETPDGELAGAATSPGGESTGDSAGASKTNGSAVNGPTPAPAPAQTPADKIRQEWYQNTDNIYFTLLAKGVPKDKAHVEIQERSLSIGFPLTTGSSYDFTLEPLFAAVKPEKCITRVMPTKVEIILVKATPGQKWSGLESHEPVAKDAAQNEGMDTDAVKRAVFTSSNTPAGPAYPTSSKSGPKNWDAIVRDSKTTDKDGKTSLEDDDDYEGGDEANHFFKKLFKGATPEAQRAMMKSYTESNGTALSTDWGEVSKGKVETVPPDGMEAKTWGD